MRERLPEEVFVLDEGRLRVHLCDWIDLAARDELSHFLRHEVAPLGEEPERMPAPVHPHLLVTANGPRAMATITCQGWRLTVSTREGLDDDHPLRHAELGPLEPASAAATLQATLRWWLGCGRLGAWSLGELLRGHDGADAIAVTTSGPAEIEAVARRLGCRGVLLARARAIAWDEAGAPGHTDEPNVEVLPCRTGLPGRMVGFLWCAQRTATP